MDGRRGKEEAGEERPVRYVSCISSEEERVFNNVTKSDRGAIQTIPLVITFQYTVKSGFKRPDRVPKHELFAPYTPESQIRIRRGGCRGFHEVAAREPRGAPMKLTGVATGLPRGGSEDSHGVVARKLRGSVRKLTGWQPGLSARTATGWYRESSGEQSGSSREGRCAASGAPQRSSS